MHGATSLAMRTIFKSGLSTVKNCVFKNAMQLMGIAMIYDWVPDFSIVNAN